MTLRLNGATSGFTEIDAPAVAGSNTLVLPGGNGSADQVISTNGSGALSFVDRGRMVLETAKASTSGTSVDFTGIPSWVKRVTVMFNGVSTNGTSIFQAQIGSGSFATSGYSSQAWSASTSSGVVTSGFYLMPSNAGASNTWIGSASLSLLSSNLWVETGIVNVTNGSNVGAQSSGTVTLGGTLDRVRITTVNGTDTFDAGSINLLLEG